MWRIFLIVMLWAAPVFAVQPDEVLDDARLEERAREISASLRCPVCQGESIDDSSAPISRDLRIAVRERLVAGDTDAQVIDYIVARYGEFVLFDPPARGINLILWLAGPVMLLTAAGVAVATLRGSGRAEAVALTEADRARVDEILKS
jgi:cytochrome c-type biogenesis protein CcmH